MIKLIDIFPKKPVETGYARGDKILWYKIREKFKDKNIPYSVEKLVDDIFKYYYDIVGKFPMPNQEIYVKELDEGNGGMTAGITISNYWINVAIPYLLKKLMIENVRKKQEK